MDAYTSAGIKRTPMINGTVVYEGDATNPVMIAMEEIAKQRGWPVTHYNIANDESLVNRIRVTSLGGSSEKSTG